jgi:DNA-binding beta-propeller fold protein YncE
MINLKSSPPRVVQQLGAGEGASGVALAPDGTLALVANRAEGTVSIFSIDGTRLTRPR